MTKICVIGGGPAGIMTSIIASKNKENEIFVLDKSIILNTILPTGGGRCNLAHAEYNFKELAKFYPRGEKFLFSIFSQFATGETLEFFEEIGIKTYAQDDNRIFPKTNSSKDVKQALLKQTEKKNIKKIFEKVIDIQKTKENFVIKTDKNSYTFDKVVIATGGRGNGQDLAKKLGHNIIELKPALSSLITKEKDFGEISGISLKNISADVFFENKKVKKLSGDLLFTHTGLSGPLIYKISSYCAYLNYNQHNPLKIILNLVNQEFKDFDNLLLTSLKSNPQKDLINILCEFIPKNLGLAILKKEKINPQIKSGQLSKINREIISKSLTSLNFNAIGITKGEEIVTAGGIDLKEINSKTMESKLVNGLYFCGEVIDVDGLTGGFNLQNCWSTGFIVGKNV